MSKNIKDNCSCSGCGVCKTVCPKNAITFVTDAKGFPRPIVNESCIHCGLCVKQCHEHKLFTGHKVLKAYTAIPIILRYVMQALVEAYFQR